MTAKHQSSASCIISRHFAPRNNGLAHLRPHPCRTSSNNRNNDRINGRRMPSIRGGRHCITAGIGEKCRRPWQRQRHACKHTVDAHASVGASTSVQLPTAIPCAIATIIPWRYCWTFAPTRFCTVILCHFGRQRIYFQHGHLCKCGQHG